MPILSAEPGNNSKSRQTCLGCQFFKQNHCRKSYNARRCFIGKPWVAAQTIGMRDQPMPMLQSQLWSDAPYVSTSHVIVSHCLSLPNHLPLPADLRLNPMWVPYQCIDTLTRHRDSVVLYIWLPINLQVHGWPLPKITIKQGLSRQGVLFLLPCTFFWLSATWLSDYASYSRGLKKTKRSTCSVRLSKHIEI
jgi:hypothetical protein